MAALIPLLIALISYFASKKSGADDSTALGVAAVAGAGSYYVATQTDWGKGVISDLDAGWKNLIGDDGNPVLDSAGKPQRIPDGSTPVKNADGSYALDALGNVVTTGIKTTGQVLQSWGGTGTAAVVGTAVVASKADKLVDYLPWIAGGVAAFMILK